jgi:hypothetical protein
VRTGAKIPPSKSKNNPFKGKAVATIAAGEVVWTEQAEMAAA